MPEAKPQSALEPFLLAVLAGAAIGGFATAHRTEPAWLLELPCALSLFWRIRRVPPFWHAGTRYAAYASLGGAIVLGLVFMAYPVLSGQTARSLTLLAGYLLALFSALFLLGAPAWSPASALFPATLGLLVVTCFNVNAPVLGPVALAGAAVFAWLVLQSRRGQTGGKRPSGIRPLALRFAVSALGVFLISWGIIRLLPWAQARVEKAMFGLISSAPTSYPSFSFDSRLGDLEELKLSTKVVMRVWSERPRKLRGRVFTTFDGQAWHAHTPVISRGADGSERLVTLGSDLLQPTSRGLLLGQKTDEWLQTIPGNTFVVPGQEVSPEAAEKAIRTRIVQNVFNGGMLVAPGGPLLLRAPLPSLRMDTYLIFRPLMESATQMYGIVSRPNRGMAQPGEAPGYVQQLALSLQDVDARLKELAERLAAGARSPEERVRRTVTFVQNECRYSLRPGKFHSRQPVAEFLFEKKQGYCEYFASAAALLLRLQGVPALYATGFNVQEMNRRAGHFLVREKDAHAWIEAYLPDKGWVEEDPTPDAEYQALHAGLKSGWLEDALEWLQAEFAELSVRLRAGDWRALARWLWAQLKVLAKGLFAARLWVGLLSAALVVALIALVWRRRRSRLVRGAPAMGRQAFSQAAPELSELISRLDGAWMRLGFARPAFRAPLEHLESIPAEKISPALRHASRQAIECFYRVSFGGGRLDPSELQELQRSLQQAGR